MRCAVLGNPIRHSLSPAMHRAAYEQLGLDWSYEAIQVGVGELAAFVEGLDQRWRGLSLTMPLKREVLPLLDDAAAIVQEVGAANTVLVGEDKRLYGDNTDVEGIVAALLERGIHRTERVLLLGAGATADAVVTGLSRCGLRQLHVAVREVGRAERVLTRAVACAVGTRIHHLDDLTSWPSSEPIDLVVSTVPGSVSAALPGAPLDAAAAVFDVVYDPWPSVLLKRAASAGKVTISGLDLLAHQAVGQVAAMTGGSVPASLLRDAAVAALTGNQLLRPDV